MRAWVKGCLLLWSLLLAACGAARARSVTASAGEIAAVRPAAATLEVGAEPAATATSRPYRLQAGELLLAADVDVIPAIFADDDLFVDAQAGDLEWQDEEPVVGVALGGEARAYPIRLLSLHEIINDTLGGQPIAVTWRPLCYSAMVFSRDLGRELTFGVSGYLLYNNLVMYDHQTNTLWSQILAQGVKGALRGERLEVLPSLHTWWGAWKGLHPESRILSAERLGRLSDEIIDPYAAYYTSGAAGLGGPAATDDRLAAKALVVGLAGGGMARAYPVDLLRARGATNDVLAAEPLVLLYEPVLQTVLVYRRAVKEATLTFQPVSDPALVRDDETGSQWQRATGRALAGPLAGSILSRRAAPLVFWFAWYDLHPETELFEPF